MRRMPLSQLTLTQMPLATRNIPVVVDVYNNVFNTNLRAVPAYGTVFYQRSVAGFNLLICPDDIAEGEAKQNRHLLRLAVMNVDATLQRVEAAGGAIEHEGQAAGGERLIALRDPDGNTLELIEARR